mgnify:CR=1 FL=1
MSRRSKSNKSHKARVKHKQRHDDFYPAQFPRGIAVAALLGISSIISISVIFGIIGVFTGNG